MIILITVYSGYGFIPANAEIYKWVDENGNVQFGDKPAADTDAEKVIIKEAAPVSTDPDAKALIERQNKLLRIMEEERRENEKERKLAREKEKKEKETRKENCALAIDYKRNLDVSGPIYDLDEEGNRVYLTEEENKAERQRAEEQVAKWCD